ncbi:MAG TPA: hypothetical protein VGO52_18060 [Hyphomonadaceae bacterium]|jgi:hypothetical protein|nr:hypothetical protein [Hyphomonadaceae bacterium]
MAACPRARGANIAAAIANAETDLNTERPTARFNTHMTTDIASRFPFDRY